MENEGPVQGSARVEVFRHPAATVSRGWPEGLIARRCRREDSDGLWALFDQASYKRSGTVMGDFASPTTVADWIDAHRDGPLQIIGLMDATVVAFAGLYPMRGSQSHVGSISLGVRQEFQGRGFGRGLLTLILASADRLVGLRRVQLNVFTDNDRAIALYRVAGFEIEGRHKAFARRDDILIDAFTMARFRPAGPARRWDPSTDDRTVESYFHLNCRSSARTMG